jgi:hypothetical protein
MRRTDTDALSAPVLEQTDMRGFRGRAKDAPHLRELKVFLVKMVNPR